MTTSAPARVTSPTRALSGRRFLDSWLSQSIWRQPALLLSVLFVILVIVSALWPQLFTASDPLKHDYSAVRLPPSAAHWFGTDEFGRDVFTRVVYGTRHSISAAIVAVLIGLISGSLIGVIAGTGKRAVDTVLMRMVDIMLAVPSLIISLVIVTALGRGTINIAIAIGVNSAASFARVMRSEVLKVRGSVYVEAATFGGHGPVHRVLRHIVPNASGSVLAMAVLDVGASILAVAGLSFLGFGAPPPTPEWGAMVAAGRNYIASDWWLTSAPGLIIVLTVLSVYRISRALGSTRTSTIG
jgi:peptide/nickel transport system permease protein